MVDANPENLRRFFKSIIKVSKRRAERDNLKNSIGKNIEKLRSLTEKKKAKKGQIAKALREIEAKISEVLEKERQSFSNQSQENSQIRGISSELFSMERKFDTFTTRDITLINSLKERIEQLENSKQGEVQKAVDELKMKIDELESMESDRSRKIMEFERRIKEQVSDSFVEIMKIERMIEEMEIKYRKMKGEGKHSREALSEFKYKIDSLKENVFDKKKQIVQEQMRKGAPIPLLPDFSKPMLMPPKPEQRQRMPRKMVRHDIHLTPIFSDKPKEQPKESFSEILEEESIPIIELRSEIPKKKSFFRRLFG